MENGNTILNRKIIGLNGHHLEGSTQIQIEESNPLRMWFFPTCRWCFGGFSTCVTNSSRSRTNHVAMYWCVVCCRHYGPMLFLSHRTHVRGQFWLIWPIPGIFAHRYPKKGIMQFCMDEETQAPAGREASKWWWKHLRFYDENICDSVLKDRTLHTFGGPQG